MDGKLLAAFPCVFDDGGAGHVAGLGEDVEFAEAVEALGVSERIELGFVHAGEGTDGGEPVVDDAVAEIF